MSATKIIKGLANFLKLSGGTMTGSITIPTGSDITLTDAPGSGTDAANKTYVDTMLPLGGGAMTGAITTNSTFDTVDIATRDGVLTSTTTTANAALPKAGGTMTGNIDMDENTIENATLDDVSRLYFDEAGTRFISDFIDDDTFASGVDAYSAASSESIKAYVDNNIQFKVSATTLTEAHMNDLHNTAITLVAAQGSDQIIIPLYFTLLIDRDASTAQSNAVSIYFSWNEATSTNATLGFVKFFMRSEGGDRVFQVRSNQSSHEVYQSLSVDNLALTVKLDGAITSGSIDSMKVITSYYVYDNS